jgi:nucleotide-binding universal stress UspA family protein
MMKGTCGKAAPTARADADGGAVARSHDAAMFRSNALWPLEEVPVKTIMFATDGSDQADQALGVAIEIAKDAGAKLEVLSVRPPRSVRRGGSGPAVLEVEEQGGTLHIAEAAVTSATAAGVVATAHTAHGDVVDCICDATQMFGADLLVVGSRGHGAVTGALLGSVSHALIKRSQVPVTIVRHATSHAS